MKKFQTNRYRNLPIFDELSFYYNKEDKEIKREIKQDERDDSKLTIVEKIISKGNAQAVTLEHKYNTDRSAKTYLFFVLKPFIMSVIVFILFTNLFYDFYNVLKITKPLTQITFIVGGFMLLLIAAALLHILSIVYLKKKPNLKFIDLFQNVQFFGYAAMILLFVYFFFFSSESARYIYTCVVILGAYSFFTYSTFRYLLLPLVLIKNKKLKFYRNENDDKILLIEVDEN